MDVNCCASHSPVYQEPYRLILSRAEARLDAPTGYLTPMISNVVGQEFAMLGFSIAFADHFEKWIGQDDCQHNE